MDRERAKLALQELIEEWTNKGWYVGWCNSCNTHTLYCPECGQNACGASVSKCDMCDVTFAWAEEFWHFSMPLEEIIRE